MKNFQFQISNLSGINHLGKLYTKQKEISTPLTWFGLSIIEPKATKSSNIGLPLIFSTNDNSDLLNELSEKYPKFGNDLKTGGDIYLSIFP